MEGQKEGRGHLSWCVCSVCVRPAGVPLLKNNASGGWGGGGGRVGGGGGSAV